MALHPQAVRLVASLRWQGRVGDKPFGLPLADWRAAERALQPQFCPHCYGIAREYRVEGRYCLHCGGIYETEQRRT